MCKTIPSLMDEALHPAVAITSIAFQAQTLPPSPPAAMRTTSMQ
jgi:hypothetical protein